MEALAPEEIVATVYEGLAGLPHFSPDDDVDPLPPAVAALRSQIRSAHALALVELAGHVAPTWR
jgi:chromate reductase, NAD(P)H dehydrogenase (quinone)